MVKVGVLAGEYEMTTPDETEVRGLPEAKLYPDWIFNWVIAPIVVSGAILFATWPLIGPLLE